MMLGLVGCCLIAVCYPVGSSNTRSIKAMCLARMKSHWSSLTMYAVANSERYPIGSWSRAVSQYDPGADFDCPRLEEDDKTFGYAMVVDMIGSRFSAVREPRKEPLLYETGSLAKDVVGSSSYRAKARHGRGGNIAFVDGLVKFRNYDDRLPDTGIRQR